MPVLCLRLLMCVAFFAACLAVWPVSCINVSEEKGQNHLSVSQSSHGYSDTSRTKNNVHNNTKSTFVVLDTECACASIKCFINSNSSYVMWVIATGNHHHSDYNHLGLSPWCFKGVCSPSACLVLRKSVQNGKLFSFFTIMSS